MYLQKFFLKKVIDQCVSLYVCAVAHMRRSEDNFWKFIFSLHWVMGIWVRSPGFCVKLFPPLSHTSCPVKVNLGHQPNDIQNVKTHWVMHGGSV